MNIGKKYTSSNNTCDFDTNTSPHKILARLDATSKLDVKSAVRTCYLMC